MFVPNFKHMGEETNLKMRSLCIMCVQYIGGCSVHLGVFSTSGGIMGTSGDIMSTSGGYHEYIRGIS